jgi:predicted RNA-binding protein YlqC (UPF0109 family)
VDKILTFVAKSLVDKPEAVTVTKKITSRETILELKVDPSDMGKVIGKNGKIARALRLVVSAAAVKTGSRVSVDIV